MLHEIEEGKISKDYIEFSYNNCKFKVCVDSESAHTYRVIVYKNTRFFLLPVTKRVWISDLEYQYKKVISKPDSVRNVCVREFRKYIELVESWEAEEALFI